MGFTFSSRFREGQWRTFRKFMLEERRDASSRFAVIDQERERIGEVRILYYTESNGKKSERRVGISVEPADSSLAKLVAAYTCLGGNPFNISMFIGPDSALDLLSDGVEVPEVPGGGVLHPNDIKYSYDQGVAGSDTNLLKYQASRRGGKKLGQKESEIHDVLDRGRGWITKEIHFKRTRLEELIIKLCDLREQLDNEVEELVWAMGGHLQGGPEYSTDRYTNSLTAAGVAYFFDSTFRVPDSTDTGRVPYSNTAAEGEAGSVNIDALSGYDTLMSDHDDEQNSAL